jgi:hypothetical protein
MSKQAAYTHHASQATKPHGSKANSSDSTDSKLTDNKRTGATRPPQLEGLLVVWGTKS